nr:immunoglobulin heavy chain junction region [Mus musculus]
CATGPELGIGW